MNKFLKIYKHIVLIIMSILATICLSVNLNVYNKNPFDGYNFLYLIIFILFYKFIKKALTIKNKKIIITSIILAFTFTCFQILGFSLENYNDLRVFYYSPNTLINTIVKSLGYLTIFYSSLSLLFDYILKNDFVSKSKVTKLFNGSKKSFLIILSIMIIVRIIFLIIYYPGIMTVDSIHQLDIVMGNAIFTNHHPVFHTFIIWIFVKIGTMINSISLGIALYSIFQIITTSFIFTYLINYMNKKNFNIVLRIITFIFLAFVPINISYSITVWKDILFSSFILLLTIYCFKLVDEKRFLENKKNQIIFLAICLLTFLLRNNGIYILVISFLFFIIFIKNNRRRLIIIFLIIISSYIFYKGPIFQIFNIEEGSIKEMLSIPMQQLARVSFEHSEKLTGKEQEFLRNVFGENDIKNYYISRLSDPVKKKFADEYFIKNTSYFFSSWFKLFLKYPGTYFVSFLNNNYGYWYPEIDYWVVIHKNWENDYVEQLSTTAGIRQTLKDANIFSPRDIPIYSLFISIGFNFWLLLISISTIILKKQYKYILILVPILVLYLTVLASPVYAEYRYIYGMIICMPFIIGFTLNLKNN